MVEAVAPTPPPAIGRPTKPSTLRISHDLWTELLCDPVMAAAVIFHVRLDAFQASRLRYYWWVQNVIDSSGVSSGKTIAIWLFLNLRAILLPSQEVAIFYPVYEQGKNTFWNYYTTFTKERAPVFHSQLGNPLKVDAGDEIDGDGTVHGPACYKCFFRNGNKLLMPAPSFAKDAVTQGSLRLNVMVVEEWPDVDASSEGINKQLLSRTTRESWNQFHPLWGNHILLSGHAQTRMHPSATRYKRHEQAVKTGDPRYANISYSYKHYSHRLCHSGKTFQQQYRVEGTIAVDQQTTAKADWLGKGLGIWGISGEGWFTEAAILQSMANGWERRVTPVLSRAQYEANG